jgi:hypothetical protein
MKLTQFLIFELCRECNLGAVHGKCPNSHPERYRGGVLSAHDYSDTWPAQKAMLDQFAASSGLKAMVTSGSEEFPSWYARVG